MLAWLDLFLPRQRTFALRALLVGCVLSWSMVLGSQTVEARYAAIIVDADTGQVIYSRNADSRKFPASLTKLMTLYMLFEAIDEGRLTHRSQLAVSKRAEGMAPSKLGLKRGETIAVNDAIYALITKSANDVAVVVAEALGGTEIQFAIMMTERARALGMKKTTFRNASGLPNRHQKSTASDMARLAKAMLRDFPHHYGVFKTRTFKYRGRKYTSHNRMLRDYPGADGMKTGYIRASGFNLVASAKRNGRRLIGVVFGGKSAKSRDRHMMKLFDRGFAALGRAIAKVPPLPDRNPFYQIAKAPPASTVTAATAQSQVATIVPTAKPVQAAIAPVAPLVTEAAPAQTASETDRTASSQKGQQAVLDMRLLNQGTQPTKQNNPVASHSSYWTVQVGAFSSYAPAQKAATGAARRVPHLLLNARITISQTPKGDQSLYRAQLTGLNEKQARQACQSLRAQSLDCLVISPKPQSATVVSSTSQ